MGVQLLLLEGSVVKLRLKLMPMLKLTHTCSTTVSMVDIPTLPILTLLLFPTMPTPMLLHIPTTFTIPTIMLSQLPFQSLLSPLRWKLPPGCCPCPLCSYCSCSCRSYCTCCH